MFKSYPTSKPRSDWRRWALPAAVAGFLFYMSEGIPWSIRLRELREGLSRNHCPLVVRQPTNVTFHDFLACHFNQTNVTPFVGLVDHHYVVPARNFELRNRELGIPNPTVVVCADDGCLDYAETHGMYAYGGYMNISHKAPGRITGVDTSTSLQSSSDWMKQEATARSGQLPFMKFSALYELALNGWKSVWFEGDTYLTGDPFPHMLPLDGPEEWDIQFTYDGLHRANFGWVYTKPTANSTLAWFNCLTAYLKYPQGWDQAIVHNELGGMVERTVGEGLFMEKAHLRVYILPPQSFMGWHLRNSRGWQLPPGSPEPIMHHLTAVWEPLRLPIAKEFGWYANVDSYYTKPPPRIITSPAITGFTAEEVSQQARFLLAVAKATNRTLWLPREVAPEGRAMTFMEVFPVGAIPEHLGILESTYWENAARYLPRTRLDIEGSQPMSLRKIPDLADLIRRANISTAYSVSLEDWHTTNIKEWNLTDIDTSPWGKDVDSLLNFQACKTWWRPLELKGRYFCSPDSQGGFI